MFSESRNVTKTRLKEKRTHPTWERRRRRRVEKVFFFSLMCIILRSGGFRVGARGARAPSPYVLIKMRPEGPKIFLETAPPPLPYLSVWMTAPPPLIWRSGSATATQQNNFQNNCSAETNLLPPVQCCFLQTPKDQAFFRRHNNVASSGRGEERIAMVRMFRKKFSKCAV